MSSSSDYFGALHPYVHLAPCIALNVHECYRWIESCTAHRSDISDAVRNELRVAQPLLPPALSNIKAPLSEVVYVSDSCESHHCIKKGTCSHSDVFDEYSKQDKLRFHPPAVAEHCATVFAAANLAPAGGIGLVGSLGSYEFFLSEELLWASAW